MEIGATIDRYRIEALLGEGGMGSVYRAYDDKLHRRVALKVLVVGRSEANGAERRARMIREARAAAALQHPNAVAIYDVGEHDGSPYIAMELVSGRSLRALLSENRKPWQERMRWLLDVGKALVAAHRAGLVHRDIKPDNVMLDDDGVVKVLDFGIARRAKAEVDENAPTDVGGLGTLTAEGVLVGTPLYMAPEQIRGDAIDGRTDQFSWGVLGWELLSGAPPWKTRELVRLVSMITSEEPAPLTLPEGCPKAVEEVLRRALAKTPSDRFASMQDAIAALDAAIHEPLTTKPAREEEAEASPGRAPISPAAQTLDAEPTPPPASEERARGATLALLVGLVGAGVAVTLVLSGPYRPTAPTSSDSSATAAPVATAITDLPLPQSSNADALAAYRAGVRALRDASWVLADESFAKATTLDPDMALAHLRAAFTAKYIRPTEMRRHFARATELRQMLSDRDRMFFDALEPLLAREPADEGESARRFGEAAAKYPYDAELVGLQCYVGRASLGNDAALALARRSVELDPRFADGWQTLGDIAGDMGRFDEARDAMHRCVKLSPASIDCRLHEALLDDLEGNCGAVEGALKNAIAALPEAAAMPYPYWPSALLAVGRPREAVQQALEARWERLPAANRELVRRMEAAQLDVLYGDFTSALRKLDGLDRLFASAPDAVVHVQSVAMRVGVETEIGKTDEAARDAAAYLKKQAALSAVPSGPDPTPRLLYAAYRGGRMERKELAASRAAWMDARRSHARPSAWQDGYGGSETEEDAAEALGALPPEGFPKSFFRHPDEAADVGRILLLAGRTSDALPLLTLGAKSCTALLQPIEHTRANDTLGRALEATGDKTNACAAYKVVLDRWGNAKPASSTAVHARKRSVALGCAP